MEAKLTQSKYGIKSTDAVFETGKNNITQNNIAVQRKIISAKANPGDLRPKKIIDQNELSTS